MLGCMQGIHVWISYQVRTLGGTRPIFALSVGRMTVAGAPDWKEPSPVSFQFSKRHAEPGRPPN
jgi:hypothetical protein